MNLREFGPSEAMKVLLKEKPFEAVRRFGPCLLEQLRTGGLNRQQSIGTALRRFEKQYRQRQDEVDREIRKAQRAERKKR